MIKQPITSLLAGLIRRCIIVLEIITRRTFRSGVPIPFLTIRAEVATVSMWDDVVIINIHVISLDGQ